MKNRWTGRLVLCMCQTCIAKREDSIQSPIKTSPALLHSGDLRGFYPPSNSVGRKAPKNSLARLLVKRDDLPELVIVLNGAVRGKFAQRNVGDAWLRNYRRGELRGLMRVLRATWKELRE